MVKSSGLNFILWLRIAEQRLCLTGKNVGRGLRNLILTALLVSSLLAKTSRYAFFISTIETY